jgi:hypothetical protein
MSNQAFAVIAATQTALAMTPAALRCEHINLDDLHLYLAGKKRSNKSDWMAYDIIDAAEKLIFAGSSCFVPQITSHSTIIAYRLLGEVCLLMVKYRYARNLPQKT